MSILATTQNQLSSEQKLQQRASQIKKSTAMTAETMLRDWATTFDMLWRNGQFSAAEKIEALGEDAKEIFLLSAAMVEFMKAVFAGRREDLIAKIDEKLATLPNFTINADGTVTLEEEEEVE